MKTTLQQPEILFTAAEVAVAAGVDECALRRMHPDHFGVPGHWRMCDTGGTVYTERGLRELAEALVAAGEFVGAHSLRVLLQQRQETPSRQLVEPGEKNAQSPWFRAGQME